MHPVLFKIGSFPIAPYGILVALGLLAGIWFALPRTRSVGVADERFIDMIVFSIIGGIIGAKLLYIITVFDEFRQDWSGHLFSRSGLVYYGGLIGGILVAVWCIRRYRLPAWKLGDAIAPSIPLAHAFGRIGCFFAGCCYGKICDQDSSLGVAFPRAADGLEPPALYDHIKGEHLPDELTKLPFDALESYKVIPTQLIEAGLNVLLVVALVIVWRRKRKFDGQVFLIYFLAYGVMRFLLEYLRGDVERGMYFGGLLSTSQLISLSLITLAILFWLDATRLRVWLEALTTRPPPPDELQEEQPSPPKQSTKRKKKQGKRK
jgi:phosphatidylglycerol:prolipoprotein diacylglycerol transferase